jgi:hypothetical protein
VHDYCTINRSSPFLARRNLPEIFIKTAPQLPTRRALAGIAIVSALSAIERQQKKKRQAEEPKIAVEDMSGELQTIPARHGVATFVPRGRTIKVINTYGKQVVSMWAFSLGAPPEEEEEEGQAEEIDEEKIKEEADGLKKAVEGKDEKKAEATEKGEDADNKEESSKKETESTTNEADKSKQDDNDPPEQAPDTPENEKSTEPTASSSKQPTKRTWGSYLPSIPYRNKGASKKAEAEKKPNAEEEKTQNEANTKAWSSYLPTGKGFSSYVPNVQIPDSKSAVSAFKSSHYRDPNKSYAEQLYDFSKTPVGAGTIAGKPQLTFFPRIRWSQLDERWSDD